MNGRLIQFRFSMQVRELEKTKFLTTGSCDTVFTAWIAKGLVGHLQLKGFF